MPPRGADSVDRRVEVLVEARVSHLARTFTYAVPDRLATAVAFGVRVRVRLAGQLLEGFVVADPAPPGSFAGSVTALHSVVSPVPVLTPAIWRLATAVADHYAGTVADVLRLAIPPRVAGEEAGWRPAESAAAAAPVDRMAESLPAGGWAAQLLERIAPVVREGRGVLVVVPDARDLAMLRNLAQPQFGSRLAVLTADDPPRTRYAQFLRVLAGAARVVFGTRAAAFAPVADLGLAVVWNDGDASLAEQRAPYCHARDVLALRSSTEPCSFLVAGFARSPEVQRWVDALWLRDGTDISTLRRCRPTSFATTDRDRSPFASRQRVPPSAVAALRQGLSDGPVLVQVSRRGYLPLTACAACRELACCPNCTGPLAVADDGGVVCRRCDARTVFRCPNCGHDKLRAVRTGASRTAEELGRMFAGVPVWQSTGDAPVCEVGDQPAVVVATPGVEPVAASGYTAGAFLDAQEDLWRVGVRSREEAVRRWFDAAALLRPGAPLAICADSADPAVQALIRWDPAVAARDDLQRRAAAGLPPVHQIATVDGVLSDLEPLIAELGAELGDDLEVLGPRPLGSGSGRVLLRSADFAALRRTVRSAVNARAAAHRGHPMRIQIDPVDLD